MEQAEQQNRSFSKIRELVIAPCAYELGRVSKSMHPEGSRWLHGYARRLVQVILGEEGQQKKNRRFCLEKAKNEVVPGIEPGLPECYITRTSETEVITSTPYNRFDFGFELDIYTVN